MAASAARLLSYLALAVGMFIVVRFIDGDSVGSSIVASIVTLVSVAVLEFIVYVRKRDDV